MNPDRGRFGWWAAGLAVGAAVAFVLYSFVGTFVFGLFAYYATRPVYRRVRRRFRRPSVAAAVSLVVLTVPALSLVTYAVLVALQRLTRAVEGFNPAAVGVDPALLTVVRNPQAVTGVDWFRYADPAALRSALDSLSSVVDTVAFLGVGLVHLFVILALAFYLLKDGHRLSRWALRQFGDDAGVAREFATSVDRDLRNVFFGNILNAVLAGAIGVFVYSVLNVAAPAGTRIPAPVLLGLVAGVASLIPVVGMKLVYVPVALSMGVEVAVSGPTPTSVGFVIAFFGASLVVVDTIPDLLLRPYVSGRSVHVGAVMLAYTLGPLLFGWYGIFLLPTLLVVAVQFGRVVLPRLVDTETIRPYAVDPGVLTGDAAGVDPGAEPAEESAGDGD
ncbi:MAG: AI-2E family transporter [Halolamina sp.]